MNAAVSATQAPPATQGQAVFDGRAGVRYGALGLPLAFLSLPLYVLLPNHYAAQHGVPLVTLGAVLLATRGLDAALDPWIGRRVDAIFARSTTAAWIVGAIAAAIVGAGFTALFFPQAEGTALLVWLSVALVCTYLAFSVLSVVHQAWGARLGGDARQRSRVVAWREGYGLVGVLMASVMPSQFGLGVTSGALAMMLVVGMLLLAGSPRAASATQHVDTDWLLPWRGERFRRLLAVFMLNGIASAVPATLVLFFVRDRLQAPQFEALFLGAYFAAAVVSVPLWLRLVRAFGLARAWLAGMALAVSAFMWVLVLGAGAVAGFVAVCLASGIALGADLTIPGAILTGVVHRAGHGAQAEGVYLGWWHSATKLNLGLAAGAALPLLAWAGYTPGTREPEALAALSLAYVAVPCVLKLLAAALLLQGWILKGAEA